MKKRDRPVEGPSKTKEGEGTCISINGSMEKKEIRDPSGQDRNGGVKVRTDGKTPNIEVRLEGGGRERGNDVEDEVPGSGGREIKSQSRTTTQPTKQNKREGGADEKTKEAPRDIGRMILRPRPKGLINCLVRGILTKTGKDQFSGNFGGHRGLGRQDRTKVLGTGEKILNKKMSMHAGRSPITWVVEDQGKFRKHKVNLREGDHTPQKGEAVMETYKKGVTYL